MKEKLRMSREERGGKRRGGRRRAGERCRERDRCG